MGVLQRHRRPIAWAAMVVVALKLIAGAFCHLPADRRIPGTYVDEVLGAVLICAPGSHAAADGAPSPSPHQVPLDCPACALAALLLLAAVSLTLLGLICPPARIVNRQRAFPLPLPLQLASGSVRSRAPPLLA